MHVSDHKLLLTLLCGGFTYSSGCGDDASQTDDTTTTAGTTATDTTAGTADTPETADTTDTAETTDATETGTDETDTGTETETETETGEEDEFRVIGVTGNEIVLDRIWDRGCIPAGKGQWTDAHRTLTGLELVTVNINYQNGSPTPDCENARVDEITFTQTLTNDEIMVPITWVDLAGMPAEAPRGLEKVTEANGASGLMTEASVTPDTQDRADQLNFVMFCGFEDWEPGVTKDTLDCFTGGINPGRGTIIVDDRDMPWRIYDGVGMDPSEYPEFMPNALPHEGPFDSL